MIKKTTIIIFMIIISISLFSQVWKTYPYTPTGGSQVSFSLDEGRHINEPMEWWYTTGHVVGATTGKHYSYMLTYFYFPFGSIDGFRILNISDDDNQQFFDDTQFLTYTTLATDKLDIQANIFGGGTETWKNKYSGSTILPFEYEINASSSTVSLDLDYNTIKRPLILGDDGYLLQGETSYTYYYSQTGIDVTGNITFNGINENISGTAWIDRQYGTMNPADGTEYEWFSMQLSNGMDFNLWNIFNTNNQIPDNEKFKILAAYVDENTQYTTDDFQLERLAYAYMPDMQRCYAQSWQLSSTTNNLDLTITTLYSNSEVQDPFRFYEGATTITGTINGVAVTGYGFTELLHSYEVPNLTITNSENSWNPSIAFEWQVDNPDDGNPLYYDVEYSTDNQASFSSIASNITNTTYTWNSNALSNGDTFWIKIIGKSIDGTITGDTTKQFTYNSIVDNIENKQNTELKIFPNPSNGIFSIKAKNIQKITIFNTNGKLIKSINQDKITSTLNLKNLNKGAYFIKVYTELSVATKLIIIK